MYSKIKVQMDQYTCINRYPYTIGINDFLLFYYEYIVKNSKKKKKIFNVVLYDSPGLKRQQSAAFSASFT